MKPKKFDFSGYATKNNLKCTDGRVIMQDAFKHNDGQVVPLVWHHLHDTPSNVLGHAYLENRSDGVYAYGKFNDTEGGRNSKELVAHGDITSLSIYASGLKQNGSNVMHGNIREVSLVMAGANSGAKIDNLNFAHGDGTFDIDETEAVIYSYIEGLSHNLNVADSDPETIMHEDKPAKAAEPKSQEDMTVQEVFDTLSEVQKNVVYAMIGQALEEVADTAEHSNKEGDSDMKFNVFDKETDSSVEKDFLSHADMEKIIADAKRCGSLKESAIAHGIENIEYLFPDAKNMTNQPILIQRDMDWVKTVMSGVHNTPFARIRSIFADLTEDDARAKGYIKGNKKKEEIFPLLKRATTPQTVYKKQKLDRDDVVDITDFDVVAWLKSEMRVMLDEELARAFLIGDGRSAASDDKINELNIRPIWKDDDLYTIKALVEVDPNASTNQKARTFIRTCIKARKEYKGSGTPTLFTTEDVLTDCLLIEDTTGRVIYDSIEKLATTLRVKSIVTVPVMENQTRTDAENKTLSLMGIIVNLNDYNVGADKGGAVNMFDDFDIDYNTQKYLIETRCSGAMVRPFSAIALESVMTAAG